MSTNEIVAKAKELDKLGQTTAVIELLESYTKENPRDITAFALYQKNKAFNIISDVAPEIFDSMDDLLNMYRKVSEDKVLHISEVLFTYHTAHAYLSEHTTEKKNDLLSGYLTAQIRSLNAQFCDYEVTKNQLERFYDTLCCYGYEKSFYLNIVEYGVDWKNPDSAENVLKFVVEKVVPMLARPVSEEEIYNKYVEGKAGDIIPFKEKPALSGDRLVIINIKTQQAKDFWQGYFDLLKKVRQDEYNTIKEIMSNESHERHLIHTVGNRNTSIASNLVHSQAITIEDFMRIREASRFETLEIAESSYKRRLDDAIKCASTVKINPIEQIKSTVSGLINKIFKKK